MKDLILVVMAALFIEGKERYKKYLQTVLILVVMAALFIEGKGRYK